AAQSTPQPTATYRGVRSSVRPARRGGGPLAPPAALLQLDRQLVLHRRGRVLREARTAERLPRAELELVRPTARRPVVVARLLLPDARPDAAGGARRVHGRGWGRRRRGGGRRRRGDRIRRRSR